jgi:nicotinamidase-related amidase
MRRDRLDPRLLELVDPLARLIPPATVVDKHVYSAFHATGLGDELKRRGVDTVLVSGGETDVCVLATVLDAVDLGLRVVIALDAICGSTDQTHEDLIELYTTRFHQQIETATVETVLLASS